MKELGIDPDQIRFTGLSEDTKWFKGVDAFKKEGTGPIVLNGEDDSCGPDGTHCEEPDPCSGDPDSPECTPGSPPYPGDPNPPSPIPPAIQLARNSYVLCSPFANAVEMGSWSWASQPIDFISVTGLSLKDNAAFVFEGWRGNLVRSRPVFRTGTEWPAPPTRNDDADTLIYDTAYGVVPESRALIKIIQSQLS